MIKFDKENLAAIQSYLSGSKFSENLEIIYKFASPRHRTDILLDNSRGKRVLHVGCCDHVPLLQQKISEGSWLHGNLTKIAQKCVGIDIDRDAVTRARDISGCTNIFYGDVTDANAIVPEIATETFDAAIFGEVLEHVGNPVSFLKNFLNNYGKNVKKVIITVPNAFRGGNILKLFSQRECINTDHRFFFTPYTLAKVAYDAGLHPEAIEMALFSSSGYIKRLILAKYPMLAEDIIYVGRQK